MSKLFLTLLSLQSILFFCNSSSALSSGQSLITEKSAEKENYACQLEKNRLRVRELCNYLGFKFLKKKQNQSKKKLRFLHEQNNLLFFTEMVQEYTFECKKEYKKAKLQKIEEY